MPARSDSQYAQLPLLEVVAPDGQKRKVVSLRLHRPKGQSGKRHVVVAGETADFIAKQYLGREGLWWRVLDANPVVYPLDLKGGDLLDLPLPPEAKRVIRARTF